MPKKKKKSKTKKKPIKKRRVKVKRKISKSRKIKRRKSPKRKKIAKRKTDNKKDQKNSSSELVFKTKQEWIKNSLINKSQYQTKYNESIKNNNTFWKKEGKRITWIKPYKKIKDVKYSKDEVRIKWFEDGSLNASANCIDRHLKDKKEN